MATQSSFLHFAYISSPTGIESKQGAHQEALISNKNTFPIFLARLNVLDKESLDFILEFKPKLLKIPSTISEFNEYHDYVAKKYTGDIVISTGLTSIEY